MAQEAIRAGNRELPDLVRDHNARVISDRKWPLKKRPVIAHIKARSKYSFLTINRNDIKKLPNLACRHVVCVMSLCALMLVLLPPVGHGITSPCFADGANDWASPIGGHVSGTV
jgi:hypothetical protein